MPRLSGARWIIAGASVVATSLAGAAIVTAHDGPDKVQVLAHQINDRKPKNVIMLLGDGMGDSEITAARYYYAGAGGHLRMDALPFTGEQTTWSLKPGAGPTYLPDYVPDSAATGTAWATGKKTIDERISQGPSTADNVPGDNASFKTVLELAQRRGLATGDVSTAEITDATPAVLTAHISLRGCQGANDTRTTCPQETKAAGGLGSIAEQQVDHGVDVILGGGKARYDQTLDGSTQTVTQYAQAQKGYRFVGNASELSAVGDLSKPVLGLFNASNMSLEWNGPVAQTQQADGGYGAPVTCQVDQRPANEPSLADMTTKPISLLERKKRSSGFSFRSRARRSTSATTRRTLVSRSARRSPSIRRSVSLSTTSAPTRIRSWSSQPTTATRVRSCRRIRMARPVPQAMRRTSRPRTGRSCASAMGPQAA
jgi:alkaline phosphatase